MVRVFLIAATAAVALAAPKKTVKPIACPQVRCANPAPCSYVPSALLNADGCPMHPCGIKTCKAAEAEAAQKAEAKKEHEIRVEKSKKESSVKHLAKVAAEQKAEAERKAALERQEKANKAVAKAKMVAEAKKVASEKAFKVKCPQPKCADPAPCKFVPQSPVVLNKDGCPSVPCGVKVCPRDAAHCCDPANSNHVAHMTTCKSAKATIKGKTHDVITISHRNKYPTFLTVKGHTDTPLPSKNFHCAKISTNDCRCCECNDSGFAQLKVESNAQRAAPTAADGKGKHPAQCWVYTSRCPNDPGSFMEGKWGQDTWGEDNKGAHALNACHSRAQDYWNWCGLEEGDEVRVRHIASDGVVTQDKLQSCAAGHNSVSFAGEAPKCVKAGCWQKVESCPKHPASAKVGWTLDMYAMENLGADPAATCAKRASDYFQWCGVADGVSTASRWHSDGTLEAIETVTKCPAGASLNDDNTCGKKGCWLKWTSACTKHPNVFTGEFREDTWGMANAKAGDSAALCHKRATENFNWCGMTSGSVEAVFHGDGTQNVPFSATAAVKAAPANAAPAKVAPAKAVPAKAAVSEPDMDDKGEQKCGIAHKKPCATQWLPNNGCSKDTTLAKPFNDNSCWPCGDNNELACKFKFQNNQGCGPDDTLAKGGDASKGSHNIGDHHGFNEVNPNPHPAGKCWTCGGDDEPRCDTKYASNNGCKDGHSGTHHANKCWICTRGNVNCD